MTRVAVVDIGTNSTRLLLADVSGDGLNELERESIVTRLGAALGALMAVNLWLGLYNAPGEWPWTYMFLVVLQLIFLINPPGRSLGIDALAWQRESAARKEASLLSLVA